MAYASEGNPAHLSSSQLKQSNAAEMKRKLVNKRLLDLEHKLNHEDNPEMKRPMIIHDAKLSISGDSHGCEVKPSAFGRAQEVQASLPSKDPRILKPMPKSHDSHEFCLEESRDKVGPMIIDSHGCEVNVSAFERAQEVQANLPSKDPSFLKSMLKSHVSGGFWLGLPKRFCRHLPKHDDTVVLVDENGEEYDTKYLVAKAGLSGGWRGFSLAHKLVEGDVVVFHLIKRCKFKVYIVRAMGLTEIDGAISLLNLDVNAKPINAVKMLDQTEEKAVSRERGHRGDWGTLVVPIRDENRMISISNGVPTMDHQSGNDSDGGTSCEIVEGVRFSESVIKFEDVKGFEDFSIHVDGLILDSEIHSHLRKKYYELCCSQKMFLHDNLIGGLNSRLAAGVISETVNIADAVKGSKLKTASHYLETWDRTLKAFEGLGMAVGFLRLRIHKLISFSHESQVIIEPKKLELTQAKEEVKALEVKLLDVKRLIKGLEGSILRLEKSKQFTFAYEELAAAPW